MVSENQIVEVLSKRGVTCGKAKTTREKLHMEHEAEAMMKKATPKMHDHHAMMEAIHDYV